MNDLNSLFIILLFYVYSYYSSTFYFFVHYDKIFYCFFIIKIVKSPIIMSDFLEYIIFFPLINPLNSFYEYLL